MGSWRRHGGARFRFRHALLAEAIYETLLPGEREELHARLAAELARGKAPASAAELAPHWEAAGRTGEALVASVEAAREAETVFGLAEALAHLERALRLWAAVPNATAVAGLDLVELSSWAAQRALQTDAAPRAVELGRRAVELVGGADSVRAALPVGSRDAGLAARERAVELALVAWGLRNAYGLGFLPDGRLLAIDQGPDDRGSRPIGAAPDLLFEVRAGGWYGWPDFIGGDPVTDFRYRPQRGPAPRFLLANHDELPPPERPLVRFPPHSAAVKFDVSPEGWLAVAMFGDETPLTAPAKAGPTGRIVVRVDLGEGTVAPLGFEGLARPIDIGFDADGDLWVLDFGRFEMTAAGVAAGPHTGALYRARS